jgi:hypothetical protein
MKNKTRMTVTIDEEILKEVDRLAEKLKISRSQMIENAVGVAMIDAKIFDKLGVFDLAKMIRSIQGRFQAKLA